MVSFKSLGGWSIKRLARTLAIIAVAAGLAAGAAQAEVISIDLTSGGSPVYSGTGVTPGGLVPLPGQVGDWNELDLGPSLGTITTTLSVINALDGSGQASGVDFHLNTNLAPLLQAYSGNLDADTLGSDVMFSTSNAVVGWRFEGLDPQAQYQIRFFGQVVAATGYSFTTFTVPGTPDVSTSTSAVQNYADLLVSADALGVIEGTFTRAEGQNTSSLSAVQLLLIPEPGSLVLLGLGALCMGLRRTAANHI